MNRINQGLDEYDNDDDGGDDDEDDDDDDDVHMIECYQPAPFH